MTIEKISLKYDGKLEVVNETQFKVKSKLPWCDLNTQLSIAIYNGQINVEDKTSSIDYILSNVSLSIYFNDILINFSTPAPGPFYSAQLGTLIFDNVFNSFNLTYIESIRKDDISFRFVISGYYSPSIPGINDLEIPSFQDIFSIQIITKFSETQWPKLLSEMGYGEKMVIAIDRPKLEGYHEVMEFIEKANTGISNNGNPYDIIKNLWAAWKSMDVYLKKYNDDLEAYINDQSKINTKDPKPEKIEKIKNDTIRFLETLKLLEDDIYNLTHIGAHPETYTSNREDALLAFRLTVSLMSYYSGILKRVSEDEVK